ncbi:uncharacterized protein LOC131229730 [Magnolia sinica]|uniref:uncharacterized protein LOC131229730 n=1 Tax=Magnolia sinica TaxID=86752 RepID=UPI0026598532|nr:uncharacterized protein LOC131229730 [Magnolia sinica]
MDGEREPGSDRKRKHMESTVQNHEDEPNGLNLNLSLRPSTFSNARPRIQSSISPPPPFLSDGFPDFGLSPPANVATLQEPSNYASSFGIRQEISNYNPPSTPQEQLFNYNPPLSVDYSQITSIGRLLQQQEPLPPSAEFFHEAQSKPNVVDQQHRLPRRSSVRTHRNSTQPPHGNKDEHVPPPFEWATDRRATVHRLDHLRSLGLTTIQGEVQCKRCEGRYEIEFDLNNKFEEISDYLINNKVFLSERAPNEWMNPKLPDCNQCQQTDCLKPVISRKKRSINWLFLLLGKMLGCCTLEQLKYFCKHTKNHRTGAKDRVLFLTYLTLCRQLNPEGPFERE